MFAGVRLLFAVAVASVAVISAQTIADCYDRSGIARRCSPSFANVAGNRDVEATNTCGSEPSQFCFLTGARDASGREDCDVCNDKKSEQSHGPELLTDPNDNENPTWWQSRTLSRYPEDLTANLTLSFGKRHDVTFVQLIFYSPRPKSFVIYASNDFGKTFHPWQFYSSSCLTTFGITDDSGRANPLDHQEAICTDEESDIVPLSGATVTFATLRNRRSQGQFDTTPALQEWVTATDVRVVLKELNTFRDEAFGSPSALRRYFYAVQDFSVGARCKCNGHAAGCHDVDGDYVCDCRHNTTGPDCERCLPFYFDRPWQRAVSSIANECARCNCNGHATDCHFDQDAYDSTGSGGVCDGCRDNTAGQHCDTCGPSYFLPKNGEISVAEPCQECRCHSSGAVNKETSCAQGSGQCSCKANANGRKCNKCRNGYFNLTESNPDGCQACDCFVAGTVDGDRACDRTTGQCRCKENAFGRKCDQCKNGFYGLSAMNPSGCQACRCCVGSQSAICDKGTGSCSCWPRARGRDCSDTDNGYFFPKFPLFVATVLPPVNGEYLLYVRVLSLVNGEPHQHLLTVTVVPPESSVGPNVTECLELDGPSVQQVNYVTNGTVVKKILSDAVCLRGGQSYTVNVNATDSGLTNCTDLSVSVELIPSTGGMDAGGVLQCLERRCEDIETTVPIDLDREMPGCDCDPVGSLSFLCDKSGGQCPCKPGVGGRKCDQCLPGFYRFSTAGCQRCNCDSTGSSSGVCTLTSGQCPCRPGVTGRRCTTCLPNHSGFDSGTGCQDCQCNANGSTQAQCDSQGKCDCRVGVTGDQCDRCRGDHFQLTAFGCLACSCDQAGSASLDCDFTGRCVCKKNVVGKTCTTCAANAFNLKEENAAGCQACFCYGHSDSCAAESGFVVTQITSSFGDGFDNWTIVDGNMTDVTDSVADYRRGKQAIRVRSPPAELFFQAPAKFLGDLQFSYGYSLSIDLTFSANAIQGRSLGSGDVILQSGRNGKRIETRLDPPPSRTVGRYTVTLGEGQWIDPSDPDGEVDLMGFLDNVNAMWIKASYLDVPSQILLLNSVNMRMSKEGASGSPADNVESCTCPEGHAGRSCESCLPGYTRMNPADGRFSPCVLCSCSNHSETCDPETAVCIGCRDDTAGDHCEVCAAGFYGNATQGTANDCTACPCPGTSEGEMFGSTCALVNGDIICSNCSRGHEGNQCERCMDGFFGDPQGLRGGGSTSCEDCRCNGNIDSMATGNCNTAGKCLKCIYNTEGRSCQRCKDGYFGNANIQGNCTQCDCHPDGVETGVCNDRTGVCMCKENVAGGNCSQCEENYYGFVNNGQCRACNCDSVGSSSLQCDSDGQCPCKAGVSGLQCSVCQPGFFGFSSSGCQACDCFNAGSTSLICNNATGVCPCKAGALGRQCDRCELGKQDVAAGCTDCPDCFKEVKTAADRLGGLVDRLDDLLKSIKDSAVDTTDEAFSDALDALQVDIDFLFANATALRDWYRDQLDRLRKWKGEFDRTNGTLSRLEETTDQSEKTASEADQVSDNVTEIVGQIRTLLDAMRPRVDGEAANLLREAKEKGDRQGEQLKELQDIRDEAVAVADQHKEKAGNISQKAMEALGTARDAVRQGMNAVEEQKKVTEKVKMIMNEMENATALAKMTEDAKEAAVTAARKMLTKAMDVLRRAMEPLKDFGSAKLAADAAYLVGNATKVINELATLEAGNERLVAIILDAQKESAELLKRGEETARTAEDVSAGLYVTLKLQAEQAVERGRAANSEAMDLLDFLKKFDKNVVSKREEVSDALERVRGGDSLLNVSNDLFKDALAKISDAERDAEESVTTAQEAEAKATEAMGDAKKAQKSADDALDTAETLRENARKLEQDVERSRERVKRLASQTETETSRIQMAKETAEEAFNEARDVAIEAAELSKKVKRLMDSLKANGTLPDDRLNATRKQLEITKSTFEKANPDEIIRNLTETKNRQKDKIKEFIEKLVIIGTDLEHLRRIDRSVPSSTCFRTGEKTCDSC
eukprot:m.307415 g.307415  ORF g.307415 m.307415 type:complete len:2013 (+) comp42255_c0_seq1:49-6087(+)